MSFKKNKYTVLKNAISPEIANFVYKYFLNKRKVARFLFDNNDDKIRAKKMGIKDFNRKYEINEIVSGDSIFCATGITTGDLVSGIKIDGKNFISETLVTHKSTGLKNKIKLTKKI